MPNPIYFSPEIMPTTPEPLLHILQAIERETSKLSAAAKNLNVTRNFTLDGRLVGDIGEMLAAHHLELELDKRQRRGHDAVAVIDGATRDVQIKCRKASTLMTFSSVPDLLVIITFKADWSSWQIEYNGPGDAVQQRADAKKLRVDADNLIWNGSRRGSLDLDLRDFQNLPTQTHKVPLRATPVELFPPAQ